jgi:hypothetical protein
VRIINFAFSNATILDENLNKTFAITIAAEIGTMPLMCGGKIVTAMQSLSRPA